jgi:hypothetical protein
MKAQLAAIHWRLAERVKSSPCDLRSCTPTAHCSWSMIAPVMGAEHSNSRKRAQRATSTENGAWPRARLAADEPHERATRSPQKGEKHYAQTSRQPVVSTGTPCVCSTGRRSPCARAQTRHVPGASRRPPGPNARRSRAWRGVTEPNHVADGSSSTQERQHAGCRARESHLANDSNAKQWAWMRRCDA